MRNLGSATVHVASVQCRVDLTLENVERMQPDEAAGEADKRDGGVALAGRDFAVAEVLDKYSDASRVPRRTLATGATLARLPEDTFRHRFTVESIPGHRPLLTRVRSILARLYR